MFRPISVYIGLRYLRAKKRSGFVSFISLASVIGIALGVTVLITVLSVMNGFDEEIHKHIFDMATHVTISSSQGNLDNWQELMQKILNTPNKEISHPASSIQHPASIQGASPVINGEGMLNANGVATGIMVNGIEPKLENQVSGLNKKMIDGDLTSLAPSKFNVVIGLNLAAQLGVGVGDKITLITPETNLTPLGVMPRYKRLIVSGIFHIDGSALDSNVAFINLTDAQKLFKLGSSVSALKLKVSNLYAAPGIARNLNESLGPEYNVSDWTNQYGALFKAIQMEKTMMFVILLFIIAVAAFNLVSSLVMLVNEKRSEIAILRTLGATPKTIMTIFIVQGGVIGFLGTLVGVVGGCLLALNATRLVALIEQAFHVKFISSAVYFVNYLPSKLELWDVIHIGVVALILSLIATIYPALQAAKVKPAEALRYE